MNAEKGPRGAARCASKMKERRLGERRAEGVRGGPRSGGREAGVWATGWTQELRAFRTLGGSGPG